MAHSFAEPSTWLYRLCRTCGVSVAHSYLPCLNEGMKDALRGIVDEAQATKPVSMTLRQAILTLIDERYERGILDWHEANAIRDAICFSEIVPGI